MIIISLPYSVLILEPREPASSLPASPASEERNYPLAPTLARSENFPIKAVKFAVLFFSPSSVVKLIFYNLGAPLRRLAEGHPGELLLKFPYGWASVPGSLERWLPARPRFFPTSRVVS